MPKPDRKGLIVALLTSPIPSHPSPHIFFETFRSIRGHLNQDEALGVVLADYPRPEQIERLKDYQDYLAAIQRATIGKHGVVIYPFHKHLHQVGMMRWLLGVPAFQREKPNILFMEHDTPLCPEYIDWRGIEQTLECGHFRQIRFLYEGDIHPEHRHLMGETVNYFGMNYVKTSQFSARPHVATWDFYQDVLAEFSPEANTFIEDKMHGIAQACPEKWKMGIYYPPPPRGRSYHLDGRAGAPKYDDRLVF